jgi:hypothetical protein
VMLRKISLAAAVAACLFIPASAFARGGGGHGGGHGGHVGGWHGGGWKASGWHGGGWHGGGWRRGHGRFWHGRWWGYGVGYCWRWTPVGYVWVCGY